MGRKLANQKPQMRLLQNNDYYEEETHPTKRQKYIQAVKKDAIWIKSNFTPKSAGQEYYVSLLNECDITFCAGPAGTGKTWIATRFALEQLLSKRVSKIIVTKPILEAAGDKLGFIPGDIYEKVLPHFMSVLDCIEDHVGPTMAKKLLDAQQIQFLPAAYARGRNLKDAFILVDEAQNLTKSGIKLMLTRLAEGSSMVLNGDPQQIDLPRVEDSGFAWAISGLRGKDSDIGIAEMSNNDIQRHKLIGVILNNLH